MITVILLVSAVTLLVWFIIDRKGCLTQLQTMGIPVDTPSLWLGNMTDIFQTGIAPKFNEWKERYGHTFGYYEGSTPVIVTSDPDFVQKVFVQEFSKFHGRKLFLLADRNASMMNMFEAAGERWRRLRSIVSPTFSALQMQAMSPLITENLKHFLDVLQKESKDGKAIDLSQIFGRFSLDVIGCCAFGIDINSLENPDEIFLEKARFIFALIDRQKKTWIRYLIPMALIMRTPTRKLFQFLLKLLPSARQWFYDASDRVIAERKANSMTRVDFVQLMLNAEESTKEDASKLTVNLDNDDQDEAAKTEPVTKSKRSMTVDEIKSQCMLFLLAGYETTHTALSLIAYQLTLNPHVQKKLQDEIEAYYTSNKEPDYLSIKQLKYMDMVIKETLRIYPIGQMALSRECFEECQYKDLTIKPGMCIHAHIDAIHKDPDIWGPEDPQLFIPERFDPDRKRHPAAWLGFGLGPRNCIGMRFAFMEMKMTLTYLLRKYTICRCDETKIPLPLQKNGVIGPAEGVFISLVERNA